MSKVLTVQEVEDIVIVVLLSRGRREVRYHIPRGMAGFQFLSFKTRNKVLIDYLKTMKDGKATINQTEEESQPKLEEVDSLPTQSDTPEGLSDYVHVQKSSITIRRS